MAASLAAATCALLGTADLPRSVAADEHRWKLDTALLYYDETDRVQDVSLNVLATKLFRGGRGLNLSLGFDSLTGASASGAVPAATAQTFTSPSGNKSYDTAAGETPLDPTFLDTRVAIGATLSQPLGGRSKLDVGLSVSNEYDYVHMGINARYSRDFNQRNTTLFGGLALAFDELDPVGGAPIPLSSMLPVGQTGNKLGSDSKDVVDLLFGVTQVFGPRTIGQVSYAYSDSSGYLNDPYKILSVVDVAGVPITPIDGSLPYLFEARPDSRTKHSLYMQIKHQFRRDILDASYRFMTDDWGVDSHTLDMRYRWRWQRWYLQPHLRLCTQSAADFYRAVLFDTTPAPPHASADSRLSELDGLTFGVKLGHPFGDGKEWSVRAEFYDQSAATPAEARVGALDGLYVDPTVDSLIVQVGYRF